MKLFGAMEVMLRNVPNNYTRHIVERGMFCLTLHPKL